MPVEIKVPSVGESITEVYVGEWFKSEGDAVEAEENVVELESDKATFEVPSPAGGVITEIRKKRGDTAAIGDVIALIDESGDGRVPAKDKQSDSSEADDSPAQTGGEDGDDQDRGGDAESETRVMPAARRMLEEHGLSANEVKATGPGGRLLKEDVQRHIDDDGEDDASGKAADNKDNESGRGTQPSRRSDGETASAGPLEEVVPMSPIRRRIAERLVAAQQTAALLTTFNEIDMTAVKQLRSKYQDAFVERYDLKLGFTSFFVKAVVEALKDTPQLNAEIQGTDIVYRNHYDVGVAIGGGKGLLVPVLRNAERMGFAEIEQSVKDFAARAQKNQISLEELQGGTFTISNGGVYGSLLSTPIVNPPQSGVLGMHAIQDRPVVVDGEIVVRPMMYVALTYDHRIVDGREAVTFLRRVKETIEEPSRLLIEV